jgi:hypothetical protein
MKADTYSIIQYRDRDVMMPQRKTVDSSLKNSLHFLVYAETERLH